MRPALERLRQIERHLLGRSSEAEAAQWQLQLLTDPELAADTQAQQQLYDALRDAGRRQLRQELNSNIGRAAGRERVQSSVDAVSLKHSRLVAGRDLSCFVI